MHAYDKGLDGEQAAWVNKKYHGHRVIPKAILDSLLEDVSTDGFLGGGFSLHK